MSRLPQSELFGRHFRKVVESARREIPKYPRNKHVYATIDIVFELKDDSFDQRSNGLRSNNHTVEHVLYDNTLQSERRIIAGDISGSILNHIKKVLNQHDRIAGSRTHDRIYKTIKVKFYAA